MTRGRREDRSGPAGFVLWLLGGAVFTFLGLSLPSALFIGLLLAVVFAAVLSWRSWLPGLLTGVSLPLLWVAWRHRSGPGWEAWWTPTGGGSQELLDPLPWLLVGAGLLVTAVGLVSVGFFARRRR